MGSQMYKKKGVHKIITLFCIKKNPRNTKNIDEMHFSFVSDKHFLIQILIIHKNVKLIPHFYFNRANICNST